ncbi:putative metal-dependent hydrolase [Pseudorhizobium tarimense]|uniref:Metal-dependent hydrolase n=1 Tax=Pseudorhizobium tarimense TaxID=1079109 RepID=A0ABV2H8A1_9HYPH|nr:SprT family zinc-dependent metalloprotease [Pseudorhizobium tarimense]MCJ8519809.1 M48 family metallopeptidase [Pseudorhizobium tarimense]
MFALLKKPVRSRRKPQAPQKRTLEVGNRALPLKIREHPRSTRITLRIDPGAKGLSLTVPLGLRKSEIDDFLERHQGWLLTKLARFPQAATSLGPGSSIMFRGVPHVLEHSGSLRGVTEALVKEGRAVLRVSGLPEHAGRRVAAFLKKEARKDLEAAVRLHAQGARKSVKSIAMKDTRSRWGSCSWEGNLSFSWRIVMAPPFVIDYLAAHEVAHLDQMNHGPQFWSLCRRLCPRTDEAKAWLKRHGSQLHAVDFD